MKDSEFIQLLNLYLDHEISGADAARLESEVQTNAARRQIYQQYCRMHKACRMIAADFETEPASAIGASEKKVIAFNPAAAAAIAAQRRRINGLYTFGTFAAIAACATIIFVSRGHQGTIDAASPAAQSIAVAPASAITNPDATFVADKSAAPRGLVSVAPRPQPTMMRDPLLLTGNTQAEAVRAAAINQANNQLAWLHSVQLAPLQERVADDLHFASTLQSEGRALGNRTITPAKASQPGEEWAGFQFVK